MVYRSNNFTKFFVQLCQCRWDSYFLPTEFGSFEVWNFILCRLQCFSTDLSFRFEWNSLAIAQQWITDRVNLRQVVPTTLSSSLWPATRRPFRPSSSARTENGWQARRPTNWSRSGELSMESSRRPFQGTSWGSAM